MSYLELFNKYFPTPKFLEMSHAGIDISSSSVRMAKMTRTSGGLRLQSHAEERLESPLLPNQPLLSNKNLIDVLKKIQKEHDLKFVEVSIPEEKSYLFTIEVVDGTKDEIRTRIEMHIEENVPIALSDAVFDYHRIKKNEKTGMQFLAVSVVPSAIISEYIALFESCNMIPISFLIENQALSRAIIKGGDRENYLIVNISHKNTVISVVNDGAVQFTSTLSLGSEDFTDSIINKVGIDKESARAVKYSKGFSRDKDNEIVSSALMGTAGVLVEEIKKVFVYWNSVNDFKGTKDDIFYPDFTPESFIGVKKVLIAGRESGIPGFRDFLAIAIKTPVEVANVWTNIMSFETDIPEIPMKESLGFGTAFGLALLKNQ